MKKFQISYIVTALAIAFPTIAAYFKFQFFDDFDARNFLTGLSIAMFFTIIRLKNKIKKIEEVAEPNHAGG
jgi:hypothetical protein